MQIDPNDKELADLALRSERGEVSRQEVQALADLDRINNILLEIAEAIKGRKFSKMTPREEKIYHILEDAGYVCVDGLRAGIPDKG